MEKKEKITFNKGEIAVCALKALGKSDEEVQQETGYTKRYCTQLQKEKRIQKKIEMLKKEIPQNLLEEDEILQFLMRVMQGEVHEEKKENMMKDRMKAAELLVKRKQFSNQEKNGKDVVIIVDDILRKQA